MAVPEEMTEEHGKEPPRYFPALGISETALRSRNPIRRIIEGLKKPVLPEKPHIPLSIGPFVLSSR